MGSVLTKKEQNDILLNFKGYQKHAKKFVYFNKYNEEKVMTETLNYKLHKYAKVILFLDNNERVTLNIEDYKVFNKLNEGQIYNI